MTFVFDEVKSFDDD